MNTQMALAIFSDEVNEIHQDVLTKTREVLSATIEKMGPAAKPYIPAAVVAFCAGEESKKEQ